MRCKKNFLVLGIFLVVLFNSIVYGALNNDMYIDGEAYVRVDRNIRVTGIKVLEQNNGAYETYNCDYSKDTTSIQVTLPSSDSFIVYEVTITNKGDIDYEVSNIVEESYSNSNIKYEIIDLEKGTVIDGETTHIFKIKLTTIENDSENKGTLVLKYDFEDWIPSLYKMVAHKSRSLDTDIDFGVAPTKETSGVYEMDSTKDDEYPVYYYRGIVENNNVSFAGFCWKIVRTTSTGGVKLIYNGVLANDGSCNNTGDASLISKSIFNSNSDSVVDLSFMVSDDVDSDVKKEIDTWYENNLLGYTEMLEDTGWCNDLSIYNDDSGTMFFGSYGRNVASFKPKLNCLDDDRFTVSEKNGNGKLSYPIALLTADEVTLAGQGYRGYALDGYLDIGQYWWLMSPNHLNNGETHGARMFRVNINGDLGYNYSSYPNGLRPSISLMYGTMISRGNGSVSKPYKLVEQKIQTQWVFDYTGEVQEFLSLYSGNYKIELWGASGGNAVGFRENVGGKGAYVSAAMNLEKGQRLFVVVGGRGEDSNNIGVPMDGNLRISVGGYNGGGYAMGLGGCWGSGGGGATHLAYESGLLSSLVNIKESVLMVAAGGGGASRDYTRPIYEGDGGAAGGLVGYDGKTMGNNQCLAFGATQTGGGKVTGNGCFPGLDGSFGGNLYMYASGKSNNDGGGGGSGYYAGATAVCSGGGGGSSYIRKDTFTNEIMLSGTDEIPNYKGEEKVIGNTGNGYAKIFLISKK